MRGLLRARGRAWRRALFASSVAVGLVLVPAASAGAHAELESSVPAAGAAVEVSPERIELLFNEEVTTGADQVQLLDASGGARAVAVESSVGVNAAGAPASLVTVVPSEPLTPGTWVVSWKVVSADGHLVSGAVDFTVGAASASGSLASDESPALASDRQDPAAEIPSRVLEGMGWLAGIAAGLLLVLSRARRLILALAGVGAVSGALYAFSLAAPVGNWGVALQVGEVRASLAVALAGLTVLVGALLVGPLSGWRVRAAQGVSLVLGALGLVLFAAQGLWSGHQLLVGSAWVTGAQVAHLASGAAWVAAVLALLADRTVPQARRTRVQSTCAVVVLIPAALVTALWTSGIVPGPVVLSGWLVILVVKVVFVLVALLVGLLNHRALSPERVESTIASASRLRRFLVAETVVLGLVVAASAALTLFTPPPAGAAVPAAEEAPAALDPMGSPSGLVWPDAVPLALDDGVEVSLVPSVQPNGDVGLELSPGWPIPEATGPAKLVAAHETGLEVTVYMEPDGLVFAGSARLPLAGHWALVAEIPVDAFTVRTAEGHVDVSAALPDVPSSAGVAGSADGGAAP